jgi:antitoxin ParD1/3/4
MNAGPGVSDLGNRLTAAARRFADFWWKIYDLTMTTMNISLPDSLKDFVDEQVHRRGYGARSEYVRELIRRDHDRLQLQGLLLSGARSAQTKPVDSAYFEGLRRTATSSKRGSRQ